MRSSQRLQALAMAAAMGLSVPAHAVKIIDPIFPYPMSPAPAEPSNPCFGGFYGKPALDAQHDQIAGLPSQDFYEFYVSENPQYLGFSFLLTANPTIVPAQTRYEVRFNAGDTTDTYFVRIESRGASNLDNYAIGSHEYGLYRGRSDGLGSEERVVKKIADPGFFYGSSATTLDHGDVIAFDVTKQELEALAPGRGFDLGQSISNIRLLSFSLASVVSPADTVQHDAYRLRFSQNCPKR